ncbi:hypothetical protein HY638_03275 [Candidatus Woesearchaeota archaeon]|nr:hypothetical protein [Candidatus Woesearchaeota archaeon]
MDLAQKSLLELFPEKNGKYMISLKYSGKFSNYNANVRLRDSRMEFRLSREWENISPEIQMGLMQLLILKAMKKKKSTHYIDLYHSFMKNVHIAVPKEESEPELEESFSRVNGKYFYGSIEKPNLAWINSVAKLGSYEFGSDRISISKILSGREKLLDYVMYHEMLHKKHKFNAAKSRSMYHTRKFREDEREFASSSEIENELKNLVRKNRGWGFFFRKH